MNIKVLFLNVLSILWLGGTFGIAQGYEIKVSIKGYTNDTLLLGYHYGDKQYIKDTSVSKTGSFVFKADTLLEPGMYLIVLQPDHQFFQILIDRGKQKFSVESDTSDLSGHLKFKGSSLNSDFNKYIDFISDNRLKADSIGRLINEKTNKEEITKLKKLLEDIDKAVKAKQNHIIEAQPNSILSLLIRWTLDVELPEFDGTEEEKNEKAFYYYKNHYFDYADFLDDRSVRLPLFSSKLDRYMQKLTVQIPDSINSSLDYILSKCKLGSDLFKYVLSTQLNNYANSKYVGMDAVYVHLVEDYYGKGKAPWIDPESLAKMSSDAKALKPLLIDKIAPNITVFKQDSTPISLHDVKANYTILLIWAPDCGHCKQSMPSIKKFYDEYKSKGVEIFAVCSKTGPDEKSCWDGVSQLGMGDWINTSDPQHKSKFRLIYDVKTTPQVYFLDKNKKILTKKIAGEQFKEVMDKIIALEKNEAK